MIAGILALVLAGGGDAAAPPVKPQPIAKKEQKSYRAALRSGRSKLKKNDAKGAVVAFEKAVQAIPDDARALSELGWAAFKAGDLQKARAATEKSIAAAGDAKLRAASTYNLGRILEAEGKKADAVDAYRRSLVLRPSATVRERLLSLDPEAKPDEPIAPDTLAGPYASLDAYCQAFRDSEGNDDASCTLDGAPRLPKLVLEAPYREVALVVTGFDELCTLALRTAAGWYVHEEFETCRELGHRWHRSIDVTTLALRDVVPGGAKELVVELEVGESYNATPPGDDDEDMVIVSSSARTLMVCGVGAAGTPSCTPSLVVARTREDELEYALEARFEAGSLVLRAKEGSGKAGEAAGLLGKQPLVFP